MSEWTRLLVAVLATWRITQFIVLDMGPCDVMDRIRTKLGRYNFVASVDNPRVTEIPDGIGRMLECAHCVGKWVGLGCAVMVLLPTGVGDLFLLAWGLAGAQSLIESRRSCHDEAIEIRRAEARRQHGNGRVSGA